MTNEEMIAQLKEWAAAEAGREFACGEDNGVFYAEASTTAWEASCDALELEVALEGLLEAMKERGEI